MMNTKKIKTNLLLFFASIICFLIVMPAVSAASVQLYVSPATQTITSGSNFAVAVRLSTGNTRVDYVEAYLDFPADLLSVVSLSSTGSNFDYQIDQSSSGNQVRLVRYSSGSQLKGDLLVATVTFQANTTGTARVSFGAASGVRSIANGGQNLLTASVGGSYAIHGQTPPPPSAPPPAAQSIPASSLPAGGKSANTAPASRSSASALPIIPPRTNSLTDGVSAVPIQSLPSSQTLSNYPPTKVYPVRITILSGSHPIKNAVVIIAQLSKRTAADGSVRFDLPVGTNRAVVKTGNLKRDFNFDVRVPTNAATAAQQSFVFKLPAAGHATIEILTALVALTTAALLIWLRRKESLRTIMHGALATVPLLTHRLRGHLPPPAVVRSQASPHPALEANDVPANSPALPLRLPMNSPVTRPPSVRQLPAEQPPTPNNISTVPAAAGAASAQLPPLSSQATWRQPSSIAALPAPVKHEQPGHHTPEWQLEIEKQLIQAHPSPEVEEPKDMFETGEEQFHYTQKLSKPGHSPAIKKHEQERMS